MNPKRSITTKTVAGISAVSAVTYGTSAFFIFVIQPQVSFIPFWLFVSLTLLLGIFWTGLLGWFAARWLIRPLIGLANAAEQASAGKLRVETPDASSQDELGTLISAFASMIASLRSMITNISNASETTDAHVRDLGDAIATAVAQMDSIAAAAEQISESAAHQADSTRNMYQSAERITEAIGQIEQIAREARQLAKEMTDSVGENSRDIELLVEGMRDVADANREAVQAVGRLESHAQEIGDISDMVGEIADQTHLLALNASIEAARAGEEGKGFAVVADAVKKLAHQSAEAVEKIHALIEQMQKETKQTSLQISAQAELAAQKSARGEASVNAMRQIVAQTEKVAGYVDRISDMMSGQAAHTRDTLTEIAQVSESAERIGKIAENVYAATEEHSSAMQEISSSSNKLNDHARKLKSETLRFQV